METTIGGRIAALRRQRGLTQEELAEKLGVSSQAVSKWENDLSCPDILLLSPLARLLNTTVDELLTGERPAEARLVPEEQRKPLEEMMLTICIDDGDGEKVRVNMPMSIVQGMVESGESLQEISISGAGSEQSVMHSIDPVKLLEMVRQGFTGRLLALEAEGERVEILVE